MQTNKDNRSWNYIQYWVLLVSNKSSRVSSENSPDAQLFDLKVFCSKTSIPSRVILEKRRLFQEERKRCLNKDKTNVWTLCALSGGIMYVAAAAAHNGTLCVSVSSDSFAVWWPRCGKSICRWDSSEPLSGGGMFHTRIETRRRRQQRQNTLHSLSEITSLKCIYLVCMY
jgi:hypothetical protein